MRLWWPFRKSSPAEPAAEETPAPVRLGLALGGGAVRGAAHVGVLSVLEREGIVPDVVAGTSVGALVGAGVAADVPAAEMLEIFTSSRWRDLARPSWGSRLSVLDTDPLGMLLERVCQARTFEELHRPFAAVACDIVRGESFVFTQGPLHEALVASAAIPGLFEPVRHDGRLLVDGGLTDPLPVSIAKRLGADVVVAVDIMPPLRGTYEPKDIRDMLLLSFSIMTVEVSRGEEADVLVTPDVGSVSFSDFSHVPVAYEAGARAAEEALPRLKEALGGSAQV